MTDLTKNELDTKMHHPKPQAQDREMQFIFTRRESLSPGRIEKVKQSDVLEIGSDFRITNL